MNDTSSTALLVMDMQTSILRSYPDAPGLLGRVGQALNHARTSRIMVLYVTVHFRPGAPEISTTNKIFQAAKQRWAAEADTSAFGTIDPAIRPLEQEIIVTKRRISAFTGSDLEVILRARGIEHLVLTGVSTSGVVLSTVREAADKDYRLTVLSDGCGDPDEEVHRVLTAKIFPRQATVQTVAEWCGE